VLAQGDSRAWLAAIVASSEDAVGATTLDGIVTTWNAAAQRMYGYRQEEMVGQSAARVFPPDRAGELAAILERVRQGMPVGPLNTQRVRKDGTLFAATVLWQPIRDDDGAVIGAAAIGRDLTEISDRLEVEQDLAARLAAIVESSEDAIIGKTLEGVVTSWNAAAERMYGYSRDEMVGQSVARIFPPGRTSELVAILEQVRRGLRVGHFETERVRKDGTVIEVSISVSPIRDDGGVVNGAATVARDVTERNRLLRVEHELTERLAAIFEASDDTIIGKTLAGVVTSWNAAAERMYGYSRAEMIGQSVARIFPPDRAGELASIMDQVRQGKRIKHLETQRIRRDGTVIDVSVSVTPIRDDSGTVTGAAAVGRDLTEINQAQAERRAAEVRARQAERMKTVGQLAGGLAHDFNNLLGAITGYAGLVAEETASDPRVRADVEQILAAAQRGAQLTKQLLVFSRQEPGQVAPVDVGAVVTAAHDLLSASVGPNVKVRVVLAEDLPLVLGDAGRLEQVLLNLAVNARDAMPDGGMLTISTAAAGPSPGQPESLAAGQDAGTVELVVADTGTGMSEEVAQRAFEPFFTTKEADKGTGLGLATVHGIIIALGGTVTVETAEGHGSMFRISLPAAAGDAAAAPQREAAPAPASAPPGHGEVVLIVDDEPALLDVTSRMLRSHGYETVQAGGYDEAVAAATAQPVDLLLTDSVLPGSSGAVVAERVRALVPGVRVLHMSGYVPGRGNYAPAGQADFVHKPFTSEALLEKVAAVLAGKPVPAGSRGTDLWIGSSGARGAIMIRRTADPGRPAARPIGRYADGSVRLAQGA
jgi:two-component system, cell cycle sensor histidine kinase and response regulator CckA